MSRSIQQCLQERRLYGNTVRRNSKQTEQYPFGKLPTKRDCKKKTES